jgi:hypothetical protein
MRFHKALIITLVLFSVTMAAEAFSMDASIFFKGGLVTLSEPVVHIEPIYGIKLSPLNVTKQTRLKEILFPHILENLGNSTNKVTISIVYSSAAKGWSADLIKDENNNGIRDWWEKSKIEGPVELAESSSFAFFLVLTRPDNAVPGDSGSAVIEAASLFRDGEGYIGYNGVTYGGKDKETSTDTVMVK